MGGFGPSGISGFIREQTTGKLGEENEKILKQFQTHWNNRTANRRLLGAAPGKMGIPNAIKLEFIKTLKNPEYFVEKLVAHVKKSVPEIEYGSTLNLFITSPQNIAQLIGISREKNLVYSGIK